MISGLYRVAGGGAALREALDRVRARGVAAHRRRASASSCSPTATPTPELAPIPSLLLTSAVHHHLIREKTRTQVGLVVETGDAREVHHMALLVGYGAGAINPYLAFETIEDLIAQGLYGLGEMDPHKAIKNYIKAAGKGVLKVMSKMGISTVASYRGAQVFEAIGLEPGAGRRVLHRHRVAPRRHRPRRDRRGGARGATRSRTRRGPTERAHRDLELGGEYQWRREGEYHLFNPETVFKLQHATRAKRYDVFKEYTDARRRPVDAARHAARPVHASARACAPPVPIDEVEPVERDRQALRHRRDVVRLDLQGGARDPRRSR